jgi:hypothetical protein
LIGASLLGEEDIPQRKVLAQAAVVVLSLIDIVTSIISALSNGDVGAHSACRVHYESKLSGACIPKTTATAAATGATAHPRAVVRMNGANEDDRPSNALSCPLEALLDLRQFLGQHVSLGEDCDVCSSGGFPTKWFPTSTKIGIWNYFSHLMWENLSQSPQGSVTREEILGQKEVLESLLDVYHKTCALGNEPDLLQREEDAYRAYIKQQRRRSGPRSTGGRRRTKRRKVSARGRRAVRTSLREGEEEVAEDSDRSDDGEIESEESGTEAESESEHTQVEAGERPLWKGFQLAPTGDITAAGSAGRVFGRPRALAVEQAVAKGPQLCIAQWMAVDGNHTQNVPELLEKALLGLPGHLRSAFSRWDVQIIAENGEERPRLTVSALRTEVRMLLFGLRSEILDAITECLSIPTHDPAGTLPIVFPAVPFMCFTEVYLVTRLLAPNRKEMTELSDFIAREMALSLASGVMVRTFKVT